MKNGTKIGKGISQKDGIYWYRFQENGKRHQISLQTKDPAEAINRAARVKTSPLLARKEGFALELDRFIASKNRVGAFTSKQTEVWSRRAVKKLIDHFPNRSAATITKIDMERFVGTLRNTMAETGAMSYMRGIKSFFSWAVREGLRYDNPCTGLVRRPKEPARLKFATKKQRDELIDQCQDEGLKFVLFCAFHAGMRFHEIIEARPDWFNLEENYITIQNTDTFKTKNRRSRTVPISTPFRAFLEHYGLKEPFMLAPEVEQGISIYRYDFRKPWTLYMTSKKMKWITPHVARHTFASLLVQSGQSIYKVAQWCGHSVIVCEQHYAHLAPGDSGIDKML